MCCIVFCGLVLADLGRERGKEGEFSRVAMYIARPSTFSIVSIYIYVPFGEETEYIEQTEFIYLFFWFFFIKLSAHSPVSCSVQSPDLTLDSMPTPHACTHHHAHPYPASPSPIPAPAPSKNNDRPTPTPPPRPRHLQQRRLLRRNPQTRASRSSHAQLSAQKSQRRRRKRLPASTNTHFVRPPDSSLVRRQSQPWTNQCLRRKRHRCPQRSGLPSPYNHNPNPDNDHDHSPPPCHQPPHQNLRIPAYQLHPHNLPTHLHSPLPADAGPSATHSHPLSHLRRRYPSSPTRAPPASDSKRSARHASGTQRIARLALADPRRRRSPELLLLRDLCRERALRSLRFDCSIRS